MLRRKWSGNESEPEREDDAQCIGKKSNQKSRPKGKRNDEEVIERMREGSEREERWDYLGGFRQLSLCVRAKSWFLTGNPNGVKGSAKAECQEAMSWLAWQWSSRSVSAAGGQNG